MKQSFSEARRRSGCPGARTKTRVHSLSATIALPAILAVVWCSLPEPVAQAADLTKEATHRVSRAHFSSEGPWFVVSIETSGPWAHWTLANPARIIVDLGDTQSDLPNAPGLYETPMPAGPIRTLRTSQFSNTPLDRRVRFTFELPTITEYEARRVGDIVEIRIADPKPGPPRSWVLTSDGLMESSGALAGKPPAPALSHPLPERSPEPEVVPDPHAARTKSRPAEKTKSGHAEKTKSGPDAFKSEALSEVASHEDANPKGADEAKPSTPAYDPSRPPRLLDALATVFGPAGSKKTEAEDHHSSPPEASAPDETSHGSESQVPEPAAKASHDPRPHSEAEAHADDVASADPAPGSGSTPFDVSGLQETRVALEQLLGVGNLDQVREVRGEMVSRDGTFEDEPERGWPEEDPLASIESDDYDEDQPVEATETVRERAAHRLLAEAVAAWTAGDAEKAQIRCERVQRYYPAQPSAQQALVLQREIYLAQGNTALAASLPAYPVVPDSGLVPVGGFLRFIDEHWAGQRVDQVERLLETWGPMYPRGSWYGANRFALGEHYYRERDARRAEQYLTTIAPTDAVGPRALAMRARLRDEAGDKAGALVLYQELSGLEPSPYQLRGLARTADLEFQDGKIEVAMAAYEEIQSSTSSPDETPWAIYQVGNCRHLLGDAKGAAEAYERVVAEYPGSYWSGAAEDRLASLGWKRDFVRQLEGIHHP